MMSNKYPTHEHEITSYTSGIYPAHTWECEVACIAKYIILGGCSGDYDTPPDPGAIEVESIFLRIDRERMPPLDVEVPDAFYDAIISNLTNTLYNKHFS